MPDHDYWTPLHPGDTDPCYVPCDGENTNAIWCNENSPLDSWFCSRRPGHPGQHVASSGEEVLEVWGTGLPPELVLPEGF